MCDGVPALGGIPLPRRVARNKEGDIVEEVDIGRTEMLAAQTMCPWRAGSIGGPHGNNTTGHFDREQPYLLESYDTMLEKGLRPVVKMFSLGIKVSNDNFGNWR